MEYYSAFKRKGILITALWTNPGDIMLSEVRQPGKDKYI